MRTQRKFSDLRATIEADPVRAKRLHHINEKVSQEYEMRTQRNAVTLVAVVFLLFMVALVVSVVTS